MCVGQKLYLFGKYRHKICCAITLIFWRAQIFEGKDRSAHLGPRIHLDLGRTVGLMVRMCKPLFSTGKAVVMKSGFCVGLCWNISYCSCIVCSTSS